MSTSLHNTPATKKRKVQPFSPTTVEPMPVKNEDRVLTAPCKEEDDDPPTSLKPVKKRGRQPAQTAVPSQLAALTVLEGEEGSQLTPTDLTFLAKYPLNPPTPTHAKWTPDAVGLLQALHHTYPRKGGAEIRAELNQRLGPLGGYTFQQVTQKLCWLRKVEGKEGVEG